MAGQKERIVFFENVSATVGGFDISSIIELGLTASANSIPQITLLIDAGRSGVGDVGYVDRVSLAEAKTIVDQCRSMVKKDGSTLSLSVTCRTEGPGGGDSQTLSINGWLLTDVSLSPVSHGAVCAVSLTFMHPICKAHFGGAVPGLLSGLPDLDGVSGSNPLDVFTSALRVYSGTYRDAPVPAQIEGASDAASVREALIQHLEKAVSNFESSVRWTGGGLPAESYLGEWGDSLVKGISAYALPDGGTSVLHAFLSKVVPECSLAVGGDFTQGQLDVGPFEPWAEASMSLDESEIMELYFPASDPSPLSGVKIIMSASGSDTITTFQPIACQSPESCKPAEAFYVPESELSAEYMYGPIQMLSEPGWMVQMAAYENEKNAPLLSDAKLAQDGNLNLAVEIGQGGSATFGSGGGGSSPAIDYSSAMIACAKAYYETMLMKDWSFTVTSRLMLASGGKICPGKVISVKSDEGEVMSGYVVSVDHVISVGKNSAHTRITCTHPRFGALPSGITGSKNALYS